MTAAPDLRARWLHITGQGSTRWSPQRTCALLRAFGPRVRDGAAGDIAGCRHPARISHQPARGGARVRRLPESGRARIDVCVHHRRLNRVVASDVVTGECGAHAPERDRRRLSSAQRGLARIVEGRTFQIRSLRRTLLPMFGVCTGHLRRDIRQPVFGDGPTTGLQTSNRIGPGIQVQSTGQVSARHAERQRRLHDYLQLIGVGRYRPARRATTGAKASIALPPMMR
jgi:hypothetical protein